MFLLYVVRLHSGADLDEQVMQLFLELHEVGAAGVRGAQGRVSVDLDVT